MAYLSSIARAIVPCSPRASTAWLRRRGIGEIVEDDVGRVGAGLRQGSLARLAELDDQAEGLRAPPDGLDQARGGHVPQVAGHGLGPVRPEQLVHVVGVDPQQDQRLVERQGPAEGLEHRAVEADQREALEPVLTERVEGQRAVVLERPQRRAEVGGPVLQADEAQDRQRLAQRRVVRPKRSTSSVIPAGSARISGRAAGKRAGQPALPRREPRPARRSGSPGRCRRPA